MVGRKKIIFILYGVSPKENIIHLDQTLAISRTLVRRMMFLSLATRQLDVRFNRFVGRLCGVLLVGFIATVKQTMR